MSKVVAITGAGSGLGRALARRFAADGDTPVLLGRDRSRLDAVAAELGGHVLCVPVDVSSPESVLAAFGQIAERYPRLHVLINNAAVYGPALIAEASDKHIVETINTNLVGPILCARSAIPLLDRGGHIINVSSESVDLPFAQLIVYQASKAGLERFSINLQSELEPSGIRVTLLRAGHMSEVGRTSDIDPQIAMRFLQANMKAGLDLSARPSSQFSSVTDVVRAVVDLPADVQLGTVHVQGWKGGALPEAGRK